MTVAIICNGEFPAKAYPRYLISSADKVVCCDGALRSALRHGIRADLVTGDLDSLPPKLAAEFSGIIVRNPDQETNDLTKALTLTLEKWPEADKIHILAATGKEEHHTLGNLSLLMEYERTMHLSDRGIKVDMVSDYTTCFTISDSTELHVGEGRKISLIALDPTLRIHSEGLHWPTDNIVFDNLWKGTLNRSDSPVITLTLSHRAPVLVILS